MSAPLYTIVVNFSLICIGDEGIIENNTYMLGISVLKFCFYAAAFALLVIIFKNNTGTNFWYSVFIFILPRWLDDLICVSSPVWYDYQIKLISKLVFGLVATTLAVIGLSGNLVDLKYQWAILFALSGYFVVDAFYLAYMVARRTRMQKYYDV